MTTSEGTQVERNAALAEYFWVVVTYSLRVESEKGFQSTATILKRATEHHPQEE